MISLSVAIIILAGSFSNTQSETTNGQIVALECSSTRTGTVTRRSGIVSNLTNPTSEFIVRLNSSKSEAVITMSSGDSHIVPLVISETSYRFCAAYSPCPDVQPMLNVSRRNGIITSQYIERDEFGSTYRFEENGQCELYTGPRF